MINSIPNIELKIIFIIIVFIFMVWWVMTYLDND